MKRRRRRDQERLETRLDSAINSLRGSCHGKTDKEKGVLSWHVYILRRWKDYHWSPRSAYATFQTYTFMSKSHEYRLKYPKVSEAVMRAVKILNPRIFLAFVNSLKKSRRQTERERLYRAAQAELHGLDSGVDFSQVYIRKALSYPQAPQQPTKAVRS